MQTPQIEVKVIIDHNYYDPETAKQETSPVTIGNIRSWQSAKAFNPEKLKELPAKTLFAALKKLF